MTKVLIISDTHGMNNNELIKTIKDEKADINVHAGDYLMPIDYMKKYFQYFVDGNNDCAWKKEEYFKIENLKFVLTHGDDYFALNYKKWIDNLRKKNDSDVDVIVFGHSHVPVIDKTIKPYVINPGSFSLPRNLQERTYIVATIEGNKINFELKSIK